MKLGVAIKEYFGFRPGHGLAQFMAEVKELTPQDREDFKAGLQKCGYEIED